MEMIDALGHERVLLGFPGAGGTRDHHIVRYHVLPGWQQATILGELNGTVTPRLEQSAAAFRAAGFPVEISANMNPWLKTHAVLITPIACAIYAAGGDIRRLARPAMRWCS